MRPIDLMDLCCGRARQFQGWYILLIPSPWTTTNGLPKWTTEMDYPKLPTLKKKKITKAWLF